MTTTGRKTRRSPLHLVGEPGTRPTHTPPGGVLVGVNTDRDPGARVDEATGQPTGAVAWAAAEARASGRALHLLTACAPLEPLAPTFGQTSTRYTEPGWDEAGAALEELAAGIPDQEQPPTTETATGHAAQVLLEASPRAGLLVIGQRHLGGVRRWAEGSTSMSVAGHCLVPVAVVPDDWPPPGARDTTAPVTVGIDLHPDDLSTPVAAETGHRLPHLPHLHRRRIERAEAAVRFAASYAMRHGVALRVLSCWEPPPEVAWSDAQLAGHEERRAAEIRGWVHTLVERPEDLDVRVETGVGRASGHLLTLAASSCLTVVGKHAGWLRTGGLPLGSTARGLLSHAPSPVVVVPVAEP